jgi:hypothetical protein
MLGGVGFDVAKVSVDQRMGELLLPSANSSRFDSSSSRPASRSRNACRSTTSMRTAFSRHSTLAIDNHRFVSLVPMRVLAPGRVGVGVVEGVDRIAWRDHNAEARAGCQVADGKLYSVALGAPKKENFNCPAEPLGQFSRLCSHVLPRCGRRVVVLGDGPCRARGSVSHRTRSSCLPVREPSVWHRMPRRRRGATLCVERASSWFPLST